MTSSVHKSSSFPLQPDSYNVIPHSYQSEKFAPNFDTIVLNDSSNYCSHLDRLFQKLTIHPIYIEPPAMAPDIENRLFLPDITSDADSLVSNWESSLKKLDNLTQDSSIEGVKNLLTKMAHFSRISREISNKRYEFQKG